MISNTGRLYRFLDFKRDHYIPCMVHPCSNLSALTKGVARQILLADKAVHRDYAVVNIALA